MSSSASSAWQIRARAERERRKYRAAYGDPLLAYQFDPTGYIQDKLGWEPWSGTDEQPGQQQVIDAYTLALRQQHEKLAWENGQLPTDALCYWQPGEDIKNRIRIEAGHTVGKTKLASGLVNHFFDCFTPSVVYTFAPTWEQIHDLLWKEIKADRRGKGLPGRILDLALDRGDNHFAKGRATSDAGGKGTERAQGQHGKYLMFVLDEAEGVANFVYSAVDSMASGGIIIVLMLANPRTRTSTFHKVKSLSSVRSFRISCLHHPNVLTGREVVPNAVRRDYVELMVERHCEVVAKHDADAHTFDLSWQPGTIYQPNAEFLFRVLGIAPANVSDNTFVPVGRYAAAVERGRVGARDETRGKTARIGIDVARSGVDFGTGYKQHAGQLSRFALWHHQDTHAYTGDIRMEARRLAAAGVDSLHVRVDGTGGWGSGIIDNLKEDDELKKLFREFQVLEVVFGAAPYDDTAYADVVTELYGEAGEALKSLALVRPPDTLEADLTERTYRWVGRKGRSVRKLEEKDGFKSRLGRSPDDGDGAVLAAAPDHLFKRGKSFRIGK